jgi:hypothetical protein
MDGLVVSLNRLFMLMLSANFDCIFLSRLPAFKALLLTTDSIVL